MAESQVAELQLGIKMNESIYKNTSAYTWSKYCHSEIQLLQASVAINAKKVNEKIPNSKNYFLNLLL
jgi:hypothetical protein